MEKCSTWKKTSCGLFIVCFLQHHVTLCFQIYFALNLYIRCLFVWWTVHLSGKRVDQMKSMNAVVNNVWAQIFVLVVFGMRVIPTFACICGIPNGFDWLLDVHLISVCYNPTNNLCNLYYDEFPYFMHTVYTFSSVAQTTKYIFFFSLSMNRWIERFKLTKVHRLCCVMCIVCIAKCTHYELTKANHFHVKRSTKTTCIFDMNYIRFNFQMQYVFSI